MDPRSLTGHLNVFERLTSVPMSARFSLFLQVVEQNPLSGEEHASSCYRVQLDSQPVAILL